MGATINNNATSTGVEGWLNRAIARTSGNKKLVAFRRERAKNGAAAKNKDISKQLAMLDNQNFNDVLHGPGTKIAREDALNTTGRMFRKFVALMVKDIPLGILGGLTIDLFRKRTFDNPFDKNKEKISVPTTFQSAGQAFMNLFKGNKSSAVAEDINNDQNIEEVISKRLDDFARNLRIASAVDRDLTKITEDSRKLGEQLGEANEKVENLRPAAKKNGAKAEDKKAFRAAQQKVTLIQDAQKKTEEAKEAIEKEKKAAEKLKAAQKAEITFFAGGKDISKQLTDYETTSKVKVFEDRATKIKNKEDRRDKLAGTKNRTGEEKTELDKLTKEIEKLKGQQNGTLKEKQETLKDAQKAYDAAKDALIKVLKNNVVLPDATDMTPEKAKEREKDAGTKFTQERDNFNTVKSDVATQKAAIDQTEKEDKAAAQTVFNTANEAAKNIADPAEKEKAIKAAEEAKAAAEAEAQTKAEEARKAQDAKVTEAEKVQAQASIESQKAHATVLHLKTQEAATEARTAQSEAKTAADAAKQAMEALNALNKKPDSENPNDDERTEQPDVKAGKELTALADGTMSLKSAYAKIGKTKIIPEKVPSWRPWSNGRAEAKQKQQAAKALIRYAEFKDLNNSQRTNAKDNIEAMIGAIDNIHAVENITPDLAQKLNEVVSLAIKRELNSGKWSPKQFMHKHKWNLKRRRLNALSKATKALKELKATDDSSLGRAIKTFMELDLGNKKAPATAPSDD